MEHTKREVLESAKRNQVKFIRLLFTDILGFLKSLAITVEELENALDEGVGFDGSSIEGFARIEESDMIAKPDPSTFCLLPSPSNESGKMARMFCDILLPEGTFCVTDPRFVLKKNLEKATKMGYTFYLGPELEYFYFKSEALPPQPLDVGGYFDLIPQDLAGDIRKETILTLEQMGIQVECSHHETAPSQHEIDLKYAEALTMADRAMTYRLIVKEIALKHGVYATFMPKPVFGVNGSGMHVHQSLFRGKTNVFFDPSDEHGLSLLAKRYIAGLLRHVQEFTLVTNQWVNSYKRLVPGYEAPVYLSWALKNRSDLIRVPVYRPGKENTLRVELRSPDPACNPYLTFAVMLSAGLEGIEKKYDPIEPVWENVYRMTSEEKEKAGITQLPENLWEAIKIAEKSDWLKNTLGEELFEKFIANKKIEWEKYRAQVTSHELEQYFSLL